MRLTLAASAFRRAVVRSPPNHLHPFRSRLQSSGPARFSSSNAAPPDSAPKKAQDALAVLQKNSERLWTYTKKYLGPVGERAGNMLGAYRQPFFYNLSVTREILRHVYIAERLQPPTSLSTFTSAYSTMWARASNPAYWRQIAKDGELLKVGIYAIEAYGIFKIGEMIGRRSLVGYNLH